jgi:phosphoserine phosphatase
MIKYVLGFDWDFTLSPIRMQDSLVKEYGDEPARFWEDTNTYMAIYGIQRELAFITKLMTNYDLDEKTMKKAGEKILFYPGVHQFFENIKDLAHKKNIDLKIYIVSSGNKEIMEGSKIAQYTDGIYGGSYVFNITEGPYADAIAQLVTPNDKPFILEEIAKKEQVPISRFIYFGDGESDRHAFRLLKRENGIAVCVYDPQKKHAEKAALEKFGGIVHYIVPTNYENDIPQLLDQIWSNKEGRKTVS